MQDLKYNTIPGPVTDTIHGWLHRRFTAPLNSHLSVFHPQKVWVVRSSTRKCHRSPLPLSFSLTNDQSSSVLNWTRLSLFPSNRSNLKFIHASRPVKMQIAGMNRLYLQNSPIMDFNCKCLLRLCLTPLTDMGQIRITRHSSGPPWAACCPFWGFGVIFLREKWL